LPLSCLSLTSPLPLSCLILTSHSGQLLQALMYSLCVKAGLLPLPQPLHPLPSLTTLRQFVTPQEDARPSHRAIYALSFWHIQGCISVGKRCAHGGASARRRPYQRHGKRPRTGILQSPRQSYCTRCPILVLLLPFKNPTAALKHNCFPPAAAGRPGWWQWADEQGCGGRS
jgi:hypothetical protein